MGTMSVDGTGGDLRLFEQQCGKVVGLRIVALTFQALEQPVAGIDLERRLGRGHLVACFAKQARQMRSHVEISQSQA